jgi:hypothetical protein
VARTWRQFGNPRKDRLPSEAVTRGLVKAQLIDETYYVSQWSVQCADAWTSFVITVVTFKIPINWNTNANIVYNHSCTLQYVSGMARATTSQNDINEFLNIAWDLRGDLDSRIKIKFLKHFQLKTKCSLVTLKLTYICKCLLHEGKVYPVFGLIC